MGQQLYYYYDQARKMGGLRAQIKLSSLMRLSAATAAHMGDSPEQLQRCRSAFSRLQQEFR
ncbi:MAG: hypothetical protein AB1454_01860 [Candidatus Auribacterota bacterium]|jgi:TPR repeat protein|uniref:Uncharacterized protein n=1 Tax=Candidatus Auribacter fodinae TaxID=2093366 RepID=A0A3A4R9A6_9BACT|nr:MAG: hypothetical protein C4541_02800 [Candidatus Auribacter fodinae]